LGNWPNTIPDPAISKRIAEEFTSKAPSQGFSRPERPNSPPNSPPGLRMASIIGAKAISSFSSIRGAGDVEGLAYAVSIDERKKTENVISHLTSKKFDYIGIIHLRDKTIEFINKSSPHSLWLDRPFALRGVADLYQGQFHRSSRKAFLR
jgi:hypothetical protein